MRLLACACGCIWVSMLKILLLKCSTYCVFCSTRVRSLFGCCLFSVESSNVRVKSSKDGSYSTNDTDKKAREGHGVSIQFDKHQEVIRHKVTDFVTLQRSTSQDAVRCHFACAAIVTRVPMWRGLYSLVQLRVCGQQSVLYQTVKYVWTVIQTGCRYSRSGDASAVPGQRW